MRVTITKDVPGYQTGTSYSVSGDLAVHLVASGLARGETDSAHKAILDFADARAARFSKPETEKPKKRKTRKRK